VEDLLLEQELLFVIEHARDGSTERGRDQTSTGRRG
jgi:hypothetical protein